jgi:SRSO17 transposase
MVAMEYIMDAAAEERLQQYIDGLGEVLGHPKRREAFAHYTRGLFSDLERKSVEPIAALTCPEPEQVDATHQSLLHFLSKSDWNDHTVRRFAAQHAMNAMSARAPITDWIIDDTGFLKQGKHSVGVKRQYTGTAGKIANCQIGVSLTVSNGQDHLPIDFELYLPEDWANDPARRREAQIPEQVQFKTKIDLALEEIERAVENGFPGEIVLADAGYGRSAKFRDTVRIHGFDYAVGVDATMKVVVPGPGGRWSDESMTASALARKLGKTAFRRITWREGTNKKLASRFALRRVRIANDDGIPLDQHEPLWLLMEWPFGESEPSKFAVTTLPARMSKKQVVRRYKERYRTEQAYEEMKGELGLDHFEGRRFRGWHHHVSVVLCCYAFVVAERARSFFPSADREGHAHPLRLAA